MYKNHELPNYLLSIQNKVLTMVLIRAEKCFFLPILISLDHDCICQLKMKQGEFLKIFSYWQSF